MNVHDFFNWIPQSFRDDYVNFRLEHIEKHPSFEQFQIMDCRLLYTGDPRTDQLKQEKRQLKDLIDKEVLEQYLLEHPYLISQLVAETRKYPLYNRFRAQRNIDFM